MNDELQAELQCLRDENKRLKAILSQHAIGWREKTETSPIPVPHVNVTARQLTIKEKITLFKRLFRGRDDVYPQRWESAKGKSGYSPACGNEWKPGVCHKPRVKCGECSKRLLLSVSDDVIFNHLSGKQTIGIYALLNDDHVERDQAQLVRMWDKRQRGYYAMGYKIIQPEIKGSLL